SAMVEKRLLHGVQSIALRQPFNRRDSFAFDVTGQHQTRAYRPAIDEDGARPANAHAAPFHSPFEMQIVAQQPQQSLIRFDAELPRAIVDYGFNRDFHVSSSVGRRALDQDAKEDL